MLVSTDRANGVLTDYQGIWNSVCQGKWNSDYHGKQNSGYHGKQNCDSQGKQNSVYHGKQNCDSQGKCNSGYRGKQIYSFEAWSFHVNIVENMGKTGKCRNFIPAMVSESCSYQYERANVVW